jgi:GTP-binding protein
MIIKTAEFITSSADYKQCPKEEYVEYAFIGRSNVGKSSLINMLTQHKKLAKISSAPGKTQLINHFLINEDWYLVDLPGYGYAKVSKNKREKFSKLNKDYILKREQLMLLFVLIDIRLEPQKIDLEFMEWLGEKQIPFTILFTKADKLSSSKVNKSKIAYQKKMLERWEIMPSYFVTSSVDKRGREEILNYIEELNKMPKE